MLLIEMKVSSLTVDPFTNMPIVVLKDECGGQLLPIYVGLVEASAIAAELEKIELDRPMTHDLMNLLLGRCHVRIDAIEVYDLRGNTFYATIHLLKPDGAQVAVDARPSDAIALALRAGAPIRVAQSVIDKARRIDLPRSRSDKNPLRWSCFPAVPESPESPESNELPSASDLSEILEHLSESAFGKWKM